MKNLMIIGVLVFWANVCLAQLRVNNIGNVKIGQYSPFPATGKLLVTDAGRSTEIQCFSASADTSRIWTINSVYAYGFGIDNNKMGSIYANIWSPEKLMNWNYKGNFAINSIPDLNYRLKVNGNMQVTGIFQSSDKRFKKDVHQIENTQLSLLKPVSYYFQEEFINTLEGDSSKMVDLRSEKFGFIAQEIALVYPNLISEDENGFLSIDYISLIPLLVQEVNSLRRELDEIHRTNEESKRNVDVQRVLGENVLYQNRPNPFTNKTIIGFNVGVNASSAVIVFSRLDGTMVHSEVVNVSDIEIEFDATSFNPGLYLYSLIVDGIIIDTKQMVVMR